MLKLSYYARSIVCLLFLLSCFLFCFVFLIIHLCSNCCISASKYSVYGTLSGSICSGKPGAWVVWSGFAFLFPHMLSPYQVNSEHPPYSWVKIQRPKSHMKVCRKKNYKNKNNFKKIFKHMFTHKTCTETQIRSRWAANKNTQAFVKNFYQKHLEILHIFRIEQAYFQASNCTWQLDLAERRTSHMEILDATSIISAVEISSYVIPGFIGKRL